MKPLRCLILAKGAASVSDTAHLESDADFRKASVPMMVATLAVQRALAVLPERHEGEVKDFGLVVGVDHGELEITREFLCTLADRGMARPFLFQSALHNATLGFLSLRFGIVGPGFTTSTHYFAGEDALSLADSLIRGGACQACLAVGVEVTSEAMTPAVVAVRPVVDRPGSGAGALLLGSEAFAARTGLAPIAELRSLAAERVGKGLEEIRAFGGFYGADAIEKIARTFSPGQSEVLSLEKPDGSRSVIELVTP